MADVDFSHAVLDVKSASDRPLAQNTYLALGNTGYPSLYDLNGSRVTSGSQKSIISNTPLKVSVLYTGSFIVNGTEFYILNNSGIMMWKVSNISFSSGDTYSFIIDIETSGN